MRRRLLAGSVAALVASIGVGDTRPGDQERSTKKMSDHTADSLERTVLRVADQDVTITRADVAAIAAALRDALKTSDHPERQELLVWSQGDGWIDPDGSVRIGTWLLSAEGGGLILRYRETVTEPATKSHRAVVEKKDGAWTVSRVAYERIRSRE